MGAYVSHIINVTGENMNLLQRLTSGLNTRIKAMQQRMVIRAMKDVFGAEAHVSTHNQATIAGSVVLWYYKAGMRHFIMVRPKVTPKNHSNLLRFVSFVGLKPGADVAETMLTTMQDCCGDVFMRTLNTRLLAADRVATVPSFSYMDKATKNRVHVQALTWVLQITPEQAEILQGNKYLIVADVPEYAILSNKVSPSHKQIYQSALRHIHGTDIAHQVAAGNQQHSVEDMLADVAQLIHNRTIH